ncbi:DUF4350 domain-containing protein [bacterium]|nr:DUF4350 domain-containing protein [bacterium]
MAIDEAHANFHTVGGQYAPFADLLRLDGYRVVTSTNQFDSTSLARVDVLVVANARNLKALAAGDISKPAFDESECDAVLKWVRNGGSLLLIADHAPYGQAAANLAVRFDIRMGKGWVFDKGTDEGITTQLVFSRENALLGQHSILSGRDMVERIDRVKSFTGQSLMVPAGAIDLLKLSVTAREAALPDDLEAEEAAARTADSNKSLFGTRSSPVGGRAQGLAMEFGKGRLVVLGEAAMLSAQILHLQEKGKTIETKIGMNVPGYDNQQFALNVMHWLSRLMN